MDDELIHQIARFAAEHAASSHGRKRTKGQQLALYEIVYAAALSSLFTFEEVMKGRAQRRDARFSDN